MAKRTVTPANADKPVVINDFGIEIRTIDRNRKDLAKWRQALLSAENIQNPNRKLLYDLYEDITLDEHLTSVMDQRRVAMTNASLVFQKDGEEVEAVMAIINTLAFERLVMHIIDSKLYGYSLICADFTNPDGPVIDLVPRAHVVPKFGMVVASPGDPTGICYTQPPYTNMYAGIGEPDDLGLLLKAAPLVLMKRGNVSDWASFNEVFGQPIRKATYGPGDPAQKAQLDQAMDAMGSKPWITVPEGSNFEILGNYQSASADTYSKLTQHFDGAISKLIVGQTMTTESGSSLSQSEVHERVAGKAGSADRRFVLKVLESTVKKMLIAQGIVVDGNFQYVEEEEDVSKKDRLAGDIQIHQTVGPLKKEYWANEYNVEFVDMTDADPADVAPVDDAPVDEKTDKPEEVPPPDSETSDREKPDKPEKEAKLAAGTPEREFPDWMERLRSFFWQAPIRS